MRDLKEYIHSNGLVVSLYFILILLGVNSVFTLYSRQTITKNSDIKELIIKANHGLEFMNKNVNLADLGLRGYMIEQDTKFLSPYTQAIDDYQANLDTLRIVLFELGFDTRQMTTAENAIDVYMKLVQHMVKMCSAGDVGSAREILLRDPGYDAWKIYSVFEQKAQRFVNETAITADSAYRTSTRNLLIGQFIYLLLCFPILSLTISTIRKGKLNREQLFAKLNENNRKYIFDDGAETDDKDESAIIDHLISNLQKASGFIGQIANGNYKTSWEGLDDKNAGLNKENIAGKLLTMREQMKKVKAEDDIRLWVSQGLTEFGGIIRNNQNDIKVLSEKWFGAIDKGSENHRNLPVEPEQAEARSLTVHRDVPYDAIYKAWHMCSRADEGFFATDLISDILSAGQSGIEPEIGERIAPFQRYQCFYFRRYRSWIICNYRQTH